MSWKGNLLSCGTNAKTVKGDGSEYLTAIMYLTPWKSAGINACPMAEQAQCVEGCLNSAGRGQMSSVQLGRARKSARCLGLWALSLTGRVRNSNGGIRLA